MIRAASEVEPGKKDEEGQCDVKKACACFPHVSVAFKLLVYVLWLKFQPEHKRDIKHLQNHELCTSSPE